MEFTIHLHLPSVFLVRYDLDFYVTAHQGMLCVCLWKQLHSCHIYTSVNVSVSVLAKGCLNNNVPCLLAYLPTGSQFNQSFCRTRISTQHLVEACDVCALAHLQPSITYSYPSTALQHRCLHTVVDKSKSSVRSLENLHTSCFRSNLKQNSLPPIMSPIYLLLLKGGRIIQS